MKGLIFIVSLAALQSCYFNRQERKLSYMPDMADAPIPKAQTNPLPPPEGSVPMDDLLYPPKDDIEAWEKRFHSPYRNVSAENRKALVKQGEKVFMQNCAACHHPSGQGYGTIGDKFPPSPDLAISAQERSDGFLFRQITVGGAIMPKRPISPHKRWLVIGYLKSLAEKRSK